MDKKKTQLKMKLKGAEMEQKGIWNQTGEQEKEKACVCVTARPDLL